MGFNTVAFILNDFAHTLPESPHAVAFKLAHPPQNEAEHNRYDEQAASVAREHGEKRLHSQALEVLPTFHADFTHFFVAGGNCINQLKFVRTQIDPKTKKRLVVLELPDYLQERKRF